MDRKRRKEERKKGRGGKTRAWPRERRWAACGEEVGASRARVHIKGRRAAHGKRRKKERGGRAGRLVGFDPRGKGGEMNLNLV